MQIFRSRWLVLALAAAILATAAPIRKVSGSNLPPLRQIMVPGEDRFTPFAITVPVGQTVVWTNNDTDNHMVVSNDAFNTAGHRGMAMLLTGNGGQLRLTFSHPGVFPYYCSFHAVLDSDNQPKAPGPFGGIQDPNGNFGTPMNGVITVVSD